MGGLPLNKAPFFMVAIALPICSASFTLKALKNKQGRKHTMKDIIVPNIVIHILGIYFCGFTFSLYRRSTTMVSPENTPQIMKVQLAPCHIPLKRKINTIKPNNLALLRLAFFASGANT